MWHIDDGMGWWMLWGGLMMIIFWGALIALVVWGVQSLFRSGSRESAGGSTAGESVRKPLEIAGERYARGEISRETFEQIKSDLKDL
jgi:putative membrane protein